MKLKVERGVLLNGIQKVQNIITSKVTLPILSHILIEAQQGKVKLTATDLDIGISCVFPVDTQEEGAITIPAKRFSDIIKELPDDIITITTKKNNSIIIETPSCQFKILGLGREDFPHLPELKETQVIKLDQGVLKRMFSLTSFAVSYDETRYILNGIFFKINKNILSLVATDGKRLALIKNKMEQEQDKDTQVIIPIKAVQELNRNLQEEGELSVMFGNNQVLFDLGDVVIISRLVEGEFPDYQQVVPPPSDNKIKIKREEFLLAIKRAALLTTPDYQAVKLEVFKNRLVVSKSTPDIGESKEEVAVEYSGRETVIGFNPYYLMDVLKNLSDEEIEFELTDSEKPGAIRLGEYTYIVLPMRLG